MTQKEVQAAINSVSAERIAPFVQEAIDYSNKDLDAMAVAQSIMKAKRLKYFTLGIVNASGAGAEDAVIGNSSGLVQGVTQGANVTVTPTSGHSQAEVQGNWATNNLIIAGFRYSSTAATQLSQTMTYRSENIDGTSVTSPMENEVIWGIGPDAFNLNITYVYRPMFLDAYSAIVLSIEASGNATLTFDVLGQYRNS